MSRVGIVGYGRFGAALGALCQQAGNELKAVDSVGEVPEPLRVASWRALAQWAEYLVLAVPVPRLREALTALRPTLEPGQLVLDVGSVKCEPVQVMAEVLADSIPWVGTHPLFGPLSLSRGERPLRVVVCPNSQHPSAAARAGAFFQRLGCQVFEQSPEAHDREMAETQALAFFVAKGMLDAGAPTHAPHAPPSYQGVLRTLEAVRADAGHLFTVLHRDNPYSGDMRRRLIAALQASDAQLSLAKDAAGAPLEEQTIPDLGAQSPELRATRELIDELDDELLLLLQRRAELSRRAGRAKAELGHGVWDPTREERLLHRRRSRASELGLDPDAVADIFSSILRFSRGLQR